MADDKDCAPVWPRFLNSGILCVWGSVALGFVASGRVDAYLHPGFHVWTLVAGLTLVAMAAGVLFFPSRSACPSCSGHGHEGHGHEGHGHGDPSTPAGAALKAAVLVVPLLVAAAASPSQFGPTAVANRGMATSLADLPAYEPFREPPLPGATNGEDATWDTGNFLKKNADGQIMVSAVDLLYAANEPSLRSDFDGKDVEITGQFFPATRNNPQGDRFSLIRMFVMCCAADARPVAIPVRTPHAESFPEMSWVRVTGRVSFPVEDGQRVPLLEASTVAACPQPEETFLY